jgi:hypothetical protein
MVRPVNGDSRVTLPGGRGAGRRVGLERHRGQCRTQWKEPVGCPEELVETMGSPSWGSGEKPSLRTEMPAPSILLAPAQDSLLQSQLRHPCL